MGLDSLEIILSVEEMFEISVPDESAAQLYTVGELHGFIVQELERMQRPNVHPEIVFDQLRTIICFQLGVPPEQVLASAHFIRDLGLN